MRKILSFITAVFVFFSVCISVYAAGEGWTANYAEPEGSSNPINPETEYIETLTLEAGEHYSGAGSTVCHIKFGRNQQANTYLSMENSLTEPLDSGETYDFSFYAKGTFEKKGVYVGIGTNEHLTSGGMVTLLNTKRYTTESAGGDWIKYTFSNISYDGSGSLFRIKVVQLCTDLYFDDVTLTVHGESDNLIADSGFEAANVVVTDDVTNSEDYAPKNLIAAERSGHIMLSWINPKKTSLSKVSLYDITDGSETLLSAELSKTAEEYVNFDVKSLEVGETYIFKAVFEFGKTGTTESIISAVATDKRPSTPMVIAYNGNNPGTAFLERDDTHSPGAALHVISNKKSWESNNYITVATSSSVSFQDTEEYEVSAWMKGRLGNTLKPGDYDFRSALRADWTKFSEANVVGEEDGWLNVVYKAKELSGKPLMILAENRADFLIDDIEVWQMNGDERQTLIYSQNFDSDDAEITDVTNLESTIGKGSIKLSWEAPSKADRVRIYVKDGENISKRAELYADIESVEFTRLKNDYNYTYVIKAVDIHNNESEGTEITATPTPEAYECYEYGIYSGGVAAEALEADTTYTVRAVVKNNKLDEGFNAQVIAVLRKDGKRVDAAASAIETVSKTGYDEAGTDINAQITVENLDDGEYELSVYLWDGLGSMKILAPYKTFKEKV